jgi:hypothetical protein
VLVEIGLKELCDKCMGFGYWLILGVQFDDKVNNSLDSFDGEHQESFTADEVVKKSNRWRNSKPHH